MSDTNRIDGGNYDEKGEQECTKVIFIRKTGKAKSEKTNKAICREYLEVSKVNTPDLGANNCIDSNKVVLKEVSNSVNGTSDHSRRSSERQVKEIEQVEISERKDDDDNDNDDGLQKDNIKESSSEQIWIQGNDQLKKLDEKIEKQANREEKQNNFKRTEIREHYNQWGKSEKLNDYMVPKRGRESEKIHESSMTGSSTRSTCEKARKRVPESDQDSSAAQTLKDMSSDIPWSERDLETSDNELENHEASISGHESWKDATITSFYANDGATRMAHCRGTTKIQFSNYANSKNHSFF